MEGEQFPVETAVMKHECMHTHTKLLLGPSKPVPVRGTTPTSPTAPCGGTTPTGPTAPCGGATPTGPMAPCRGALQWLSVTALDSLPMSSQPEWQLERFWNSVHSGAEIHFPRIT